MSAHRSAAGTLLQPGAPLALLLLRCLRSRTLPQVRLLRTRVRRHAACACTSPSPPRLDAARGVDQHVAPRGACVVSESRRDHATPRTVEMRTLGPCQRRPRLKCDCSGHRGVHNHSFRLSRGPGVRGADEIRMRIRDLCYFGLRRQQRRDVVRFAVQQADTAERRITPAGAASFVQVSPCGPSSIHRPPRPIRRVSGAGLVVAGALSEKCPHAPAFRRFRPPSDSGWPWCQPLTVTSRWALSAGRSPRRRRRSRRRGCPVPYRVRSAPAGRGPLRATLRAQAGSPPPRRR